MGIRPGFSMSGLIAESVVGIYLYARFCDLKPPQCGPCRFAIPIS